MMNQRTIEGIFIAGAAKRSTKHLVKQTFNDSFLSRTIVANKLLMAPPMRAEEIEFDIQKVNGALERQMRLLQRLIFQVWHKINRLICLDPQCFHNILRLKFERNVSRYYS